MNILRGPTDEETWDALQDKSASEIFYFIHKYELKKHFFELGLDKLELLSGQAVLDLSTKYQLGDIGMDIAVKKGILKKISTERLLTKAVQSNSLKYVKYALRKGARGLPIPGSGFTALMLAAANNYFEMVDNIINYGLDLNITDRQGWSALMHASYHCSIESLKLLIDTGANLNIQNNTGRTALMFAVIKDDMTTFNLLADNGANILLRDHNNKTAYDYSRSRTMIEKILREKMINLRKSLRNDT